MGYRIDYSSGQAKRQKLSLSVNKTVVKVTAMVAVLLLMVSFAGLAGDQIKEFLLPGDPEVTEMALQEMAADIRSGEDFRDAFAAFCQKILDNAGVYE